MISRVVRTSVLVNILGLSAGIIGAEQFVGTLVAKVLSQQVSEDGGGRIRDGYLDLDYLHLPFPTIACGRASHPFVPSHDEPMSDR